MSSLRIRQKPERKLEAKRRNMRRGKFGWEKWERRSDIIAINFHKIAKYKIEIHQRLSTLATETM